jgi:hypothetical protein
MAGVAEARDYRKEKLEEKCTLNTDESDALLLFRALNHGPVANLQQMDDLHYKPGCSGGMGNRSYIPCLSIHS